MSDSDDEIEQLLKTINNFGPMPEPDLVNRVKKSDKPENIKRGEETEEIPATILRKEKPIDVSIDETPAKSEMPKASNDIRQYKEEDTALIQAPKKDQIESSDELISQFKGAIGKFNEITDEILTNYRTDRQQAQAAIDHYFQIIEQGGKVPRVYIEKLADIIRSKNEIAMTPVRLLDSITRFMAASKNNNVLINNNTSIGVNNLTALLDDAENVDESG